jgi:transposase
MTYRHTLPCMSARYASDLTDAEWEGVQRYLLPASTRGRPPMHPSRRILDAIFYMLCTGCAWRYLPSNFPPWQTSETLIELAASRLVLRRLTPPA